MIKSRATAAFLPSNHAIGDIVWFQPNAALIDQKGFMAESTGIHKVKIMNVKFTLSKVLYDIALPGLVEGQFDEQTPVCNVDSFLLNKPEWVVPV